MQADHPQPTKGLAEPPTAQAPAAAEESKEAPTIVTSTSARYGHAWTPRRTHRTIAPPTNAPQRRVTDRGGTPSASRRT